MKIDWYEFFIACVGAICVCVLLTGLGVLGGCTGAAAAAGPTEAEAAVTGEWAAALPAGGLVQMSLYPKRASAPSGAYQVMIEPGAGPMKRERGTWLLRASRVVFSPETCEAADQAGAPLHLVVCGGPDSIPAAAAGDRWPVALVVGGQLVQLNFYRL